MEFRDVVRRRRMVRRFATEPVDHQVLERVLETARHAPSAGFSQGFRLVVLQEAERLEWFWRLTHQRVAGEDIDELIAAGPPVIALPFISKSTYLQRYSEADKAPFGLQDETQWPVPFWHVDAGMSILLILLAAVDEGLGAWYFGISDGEKELLRELGVPDEYSLEGAIGLGHRLPEEDATGSASTRRRVAVDDLIHDGRW